MPRNTQATTDFLREKFVGKTVVIDADVQGASDAYVGSKGVINDVSYNYERTTFKIKFTESANPRLKIGVEHWFYSLEFTPIEVDPNEVKVKGLEKRKRTVEEIDRYGNEYVIELFKDEEKVIYLSSALRTLLDVKDGDRIGFAIDRKQKKYYIYKEDDEQAGHLVKEGRVDNNVEWRNLYNTFNPETQAPNKGKLKFHISHYLEKHSDYPEYTFFLISEEWYEKKVEKPLLKRVPSAKEKKINPEEVVGSDAWVRAQMEQQENIQRGILRGATMREPVLYTFGQEEPVITNTTSSTSF